MSQIIDLTGLVLAATVKAPYTTVGGPMAVAQADNDIILLGDFLLQLQSASDFPTYDNGKEYDNGDLVKYNSGVYLQTYAGSPTTSTGNNPADVNYWTEVSIGVGAHQKNRDQYLDFTGTNEVSAAELKALVDGAQILTFSETISSESIKNGNSSPTEVIATPGVGKLTEIQSAFIHYDFDTGSPADTEYSTATDVHLITDTADIPQFVLEAILGKTDEAIKKMVAYDDSSELTQLLTDKAVNFFVPAADPTLGTPSITIYGTYRTVTIP